MKYRAKVTATEELARAIAEVANLTIVKDAKDTWLECNLEEEAELWEQINNSIQLLRNYYMKY